MASSIMTLQEAARQLESPDHATRQQAADFLSRQGEEVREVAAPVASHVGDEDRIVAEYCVAALEEMGPPAEVQLPALAELLTAAHPDVVYWGATLLGRSGDAAAPYAQRLADVAESPLPLPVRQRGIWALGRIGRRAAPMATRLRLLAAQGPASLQREIALALASIDS